MPAEELLTLEYRVRNLQLPMCRLSRYAESFAVDSCRSQTNKTLCSGLQKVEYIFAVYVLPGGGVLACW